MTSNRATATEKAMTSQEREFWERLKDWHLNDIDICLANGANYAAARTMLSYVDILGGFYGGLIKREGDYCVRVQEPGTSKNSVKINNDEYEKSGTKKQFFRFVRKYMNAFYRIKVKVRTEHIEKELRLADILYDHFRCGLVHEGHPKLGTEIVRENSDVILRVRSDFNVNKPLASLNILALRDKLRSATFQFERDLNDASHPERLARWRERYEFLYAEFRL